MAMRTDLEALLRPLRRARPWVVGQLGQSLDGRIATVSGHSHYINGPEDLRRLHHVRALADAVVVGAGTVAADDPQLTVRRAEGANPVRVVLDPVARLDPGARVFRDGHAPTVHVVAEGVEVDGPTSEDVTLLRLATVEGSFDPHEVVARLAERGLGRVLVEGGGLTVSRFLEAGALHRLHVSVAPLLLGSGRPSITLPEVETLDQAVRPPVRHVRLGDDLVFDLELEPPPPGGSTAGPPART